MVVESTRAVIMDLLKNKLSGFTFWTKIESKIALFCAELPEINSEGQKEEFISKLKSIKEYLLDEELTEESVSFLDEEIERYDKTKTISLYVDEEDDLDYSIIENYSKLGAGTEGVVGIHHNFNYSQLSKLTNGVFNQTGLIKFYISKERSISGKIVAEIYDFPQKIPIASLIESKTEDKDTGEKKRRIVLFGNKIDNRNFSRLKEINLPFYVYRFITDKREDVILMTNTSCEIGDYVVTGVMTQCDDYKMLTDSARLPTKLPFFFAQTIQNRIIKYKNHDEFFEKVKDLGINTKSFFDFPFTISKGNRTWILKHPEWYKWLLWSWLTHQAKGLLNNYPLHLFIVGPKHSGKSLTLNGFHAKSKESGSIFSGSSSTLKALVPSFKYNPARLGYLAESNRFAYCDEFLRCMVNTRTTKEGSSREESVAIMNDLLEHQKREASSGVSKVKVNMTSRIMATTNPIREIHNATALINAFDESFLSRWMIYFQTPDHVKLIRKSKDSDLKRYQYHFKTNDWISIVDYLHTFSAEYDPEKIDEILNSVPKVLSETLKSHYDARHGHHIECLIDGIVKTRCLLESDKSFEAKEEDYEILKKIWLSIIRSWINPEHLRTIDLKERIFYLPENCQYLYWKVCNLKNKVANKEVEKIALLAMNMTEYVETINILKDNGLIKEYDGYVKPFYMEDSDQGTL